MSVGVKRKGDQHPRTQHLSLLQTPKSYPRHNTLYAKVVIEGRVIIRSSSLHTHLGNTFGVDRDVWGRRAGLSILNVHTRETVYLALAS